MTSGFAMALGAATAEHLRAGSSRAPKVVVGRDTRRSGSMLAAAVVTGLSSRGADVVDLGVMPTPGVSRLVLATGADAGVVVSASHNPYQDNGLKVFGSDGSKLADEQELALEEGIERYLEAGGDPWPEMDGQALGEVRRYRHDDGHYQDFLLANAPYLDGLRVALDCANGAAYQVAPRVFKQIGARLDVLFDRPDGRNINVGCGSTHPEAVRERVLKNGMDVGITFDGDADRALLVDRHGRLVSGDHVLAICAMVRGERRVVATQMTNLGTERFLAEQGIQLERVQVGDRYVFERLRDEGLKLGGEQSGHLLFLDKAPTGDGILTALQLLSACRASGSSLEDWMDRIPVYPQSLSNVSVPAAAKAELAHDDEVLAVVAEAESALGEQGRVNLRPSGTEPLVRVMVEANSQELVDHWSQRLVTAVERAAQRPTAAA